MIVQHNMAAANANRMLGITTGNLAKNSEKLSSGYRINRAADDAAGLSISEKMRKQIRGINQASANAEDGISAVQTAEGALTEVHSMLRRMNELAVQASNGTMSEDDRQNVQDEIDALVTEIDRVSTTTKFNEKYLLKGNGPGDYKDLNVATATNNGVGTTTQDTNGLSSVTLTGGTAVFGKDATEKVTIGNVDYDLKDYANAKELADDISGNSKVALAASNYDYSGYTAGAITGSGVGEVQISNASTVSDDSALNDIQEVSFEIGLTGAIATDGTLALDIGGTNVNVDLLATDSEDIMRIKVSNALKEEFGNDNVTLSGDKFSIKLAASETTINVQAVREVEDLEINLQVGADSSSDNKIKVAISSMSSESIGVAGLKVTSEKSATRAIDTISDAIKAVSAQRSKLGAVQNRLEHTIANLDNVAENTTAAESRIRDVDMASEMVNYSKNNILQQAGTSMLAQANQSTQGVLSLLQ